MQFVQSIIDRGFTVFNVDANKRPCNKSGYMLKGWESISADDVKAHHNYDSLQWGLRTGTHSNGRAIMSLDFDCCGKPVSGVRIGCNYTKTKLATWMDMGNMDGTYSSSTLGNMNVLVDYTDSPTLVNATRGRGKYTRKGTDLEVLMGSGCQQVIPPSTTKCKISGLAEHSRTFLNENPLLVVREGSAEMEYILSLITDEPAEAKAEAPTVPKRRVVKRKIQNQTVSDADTETDTTAPADKWLILLNDVIGNGCDDRGVNVVDWDTWFQIAGILKSNKYSKEVFMKYSEQSANCGASTASQLWDGIKKNKMSLFGLQSIAKKINPDGYSEWLGDHKGSRIAKNDLEASEMIMGDLCDILKVDGKGRTWMKKGNIWLDNMESIKEAVYMYVLRSGISKPEGMAYTQNATPATQIASVVLTMARQELVDPHLYAKMKSSTKHRLAFEDGILNFKDQSFTLWADVNFEYYTTHLIPFPMADYFAHPDEAVIAEVNTTIFKALFGEKAGNALHHLARALAGNGEDKNLASYMGNRNCGKGVIFDLLKNAFDAYVVSFNLPHIMYVRKTEDAECARQNYWMLELEHARLAISQETPDPKLNLKIDGEKIKKLVSGGDEITARRNFDRRDTVFKTSVSPFIMGNFPVKFDTVDVWEHVIQFESTYQYVSEEEIERKKKEYPGQDMMWSNLRVKDYSVKTEKVVSSAWAKATVMLICRSWESTPAQVYRDHSENNEECGIRATIIKHLKITKKEGDEVLSSAVYKRFNGISDKKLKAELISMGVKFIKATKGNNIKKYVFVGCILLDVDEEEAEDLGGF